MVSGYLDDSQFPHYVNLAQIQRIQALGHEIGCHTASHKHLPREPEKIMRNEIFLSRSFFQHHGITTDTFAYPFGEYDERVQQIVKEAGFHGARSAIRGFNDRTIERSLLQCQAVKLSTTTAQVIDWIEAAKTQEKWLILMFHQVDLEGRELSTRPETLGAIAEYLARTNRRTITVRDGLRLLDEEAEPAEPGIEMATE